LQTLDLDKSTLSGRVLHTFTIIFAFTGIVLSLFSIVNCGLYDYIQLDFLVTHSITALSAAVSFLTTYMILSYLYPLNRLIVSLTLTTLAIHFYDFVWSIGYFLYTQQGLNWSSLLISLGLSFLLERLDNKHGIFRKKYLATSLGLVVILISLMIGLYRSGFYQGMVLYEQGLGPDPNQGNVWWLLSKIIVWWITVPLLDRRKTKVSLRMDPRVLLW